MIDPEFIEWLRHLRGKVFFTQTPFGNFDFTIQPRNVYVNRKPPITSEEVLAFTRFINSYDGYISDWLQTNNNYGQNQSDAPFC